MPQTIKDFLLGGWGDVLGRSGQKTLRHLGSGKKTSLYDSCKVLDTKQRKGETKKNTKKQKKMWEVLNFYLKNNRALVTQNTVLFKFNSPKMRVVHRNSWPDFPFLSAMHPVLRWLQQLDSCLANEK